MIDVNRPTYPTRTGDEAGVRYSSGYVDLKPLDRIRWGPVIGGLFASLAVLTLLSVLGLAIGLSTYDAGDRLSNFGLGAGIWAAASAVVAFFVGGWLAGASAARRSAGAGLLQGTMVWCASLALMIYLIAGGLSGIVRTTAGAAGTAAGTTAGPAVHDPAANVGDAARRAQDAAVRTGERITNAVTPGDVNRTADSAARGAWGTLISMLVGLGAAAFGGYLGGRNPDNDRIADYFPGGRASDEAAGLRDRGTTVTTTTTT